MADLGPIRALLLEGDADSAVLTRDMLDDASAGLVDLVHVEQLAPAIERLASESFDVILFRALALEQRGTERIDRLLLQAPGVPIIVLALLPEADQALPMIRYGAQDFWVSGRDTGEALLRAMRYAIERKPRLELLTHQAYFDRSAATGSSLAARSAGVTLATIASSRSSTAPSANDAGSRSETP